VRRAPSLAEDSAERVKEKILADMEAAFTPLLDVPPTATRLTKRAERFVDIHAPRWEVDGSWSYQCNCLAAPGLHPASVSGAYCACGKNYNRPVPLPR
jgi:hypothetical protein